MTDRDIRVEGILCGALTQRGGRVFLLGDNDWKVVPF